MLCQVILAFPVNVRQSGPASGQGRRFFQGKVSTPADLYLGTANGMNLLTNPNDNLPDGGWEMRRLVE